QATAAGDNGEQLIKGEDGTKELLQGTQSTGTQGVTGFGGQTDVNETGTNTDNRTTTSDPSGATSGKDGDYINDKYNRLYDNNIIEEAIKVAPGSVKKNRISVVVDDGVAASSADAVKEFVQAYM